MILKRDKIKYSAVALWVIFFSVCFLLYFLKGDLLVSKFKEIFGASIIFAYVIYLVASCLRGFTLIPITYFILVGIVLFPPWPLYIMTMVGMVVSSICVYYFSEYMNFDQYFEKNHSKEIAKVKEVLSRHELPIVIAWSFMPFLPTDVMCYVCGTLRINVKKFLLGVIIGEGIACAIYIFLGKEIISYLF